MRRDWKRKKGIKTNEKALRYSTYSITTNITTDHALEQNKKYSLITHLPHTMVHITDHTVRDIGHNTIVMDGRLQIALQSSPIHADSLCRRYNPCHGQNPSPHHTRTADFLYQVSPPAQIVTTTPPTSVPKALQNRGRL